MIRLNIYFANVCKRYMNLWHSPTSWGQSTPKAMYIVIPESPKESPVESTERLENLPPDVLFRRGARQKILFDTEIDHVVRDSQRVTRSPSNSVVNQESLASVTQTYDSVVGKIQRAFLPLMDTCQGSLVAWLTNDDPASLIVHNGLVHKLNNAKFYRGANVELHPILVQIAQNTQALNEYEKAALELYLKDYRESGGLLDNTNHSNLEKYNKEILVKQRVFHEFVKQADRKYHQVISDPKSGAELSQWMRRRLAIQPECAESGPWVMRLEPDLARNYLSHCSDRSKRWSCWLALQQRAGPQAFTKSQTDNYLNITHLRRLRHSLAELFNYENHAERVLSSNMAGNVATVVEQIDAYRLKYREAAIREVNELLVEAQSEGFDDSRLQCWDLAFWERCSEERRYAPLGGSTLAGAFTPQSALSGLFQLTHELLGVEVKPTDDETLFHFYEKDVLVGRFRLDWTRRNIYEARARCLPLHTASRSSPACSYLFINSDSCMTLRQVHVLCEAWGDLLQQSLTRVQDMPEISGQHGLASDARNICAFAWRRLLMRNGALLRRLALPDAALTDEKVCQLSTWRSPLAATNLMEKLYRAAFDLDIWVGPEHWAKVQKDLWPEFMPVRRDPLDEWPCSAINIFAKSDGAATQYADVWAETVAEDICQAFVEKGVVTCGDEVRAVGSRFRETFLALGSAVPAREVFRRFRGRDCREVADIL